MTKTSKQSTERTPAATAHTTQPSAELETILHDPNNDTYQQALRIVRKHRDTTLTFGDLDNAVAVDNLEQAILRNIDAWFSHYNALAEPTVEDRNVALALVLLDLAIAGPDELSEAA